MATKKTEACLECNAEYRLSYDLDKNYYKPEYCPFCGSAIWHEDETEITGDEE